MTTKQLLALGQAAELELSRRRCKESLLYLTQYLYKRRHGRRFVVSRHHEIICEALEKVLRGEITRLIINIAPRYSKTELAVKNFIAHGLALNPSAKFIHLTYAAKLALDNSEESKDIVNSEWYQEMFPDVKIKKDSKAKDKWYTTTGGGVYAAASGGQVTGFGAGKVDDDEEEGDPTAPKPEEDDQGKIDQEEMDMVSSSIAAAAEKGEFGGAIIIDDPIKPEDGHSLAKRRRVNERFESTIRSRVNSRKTPIIIIGQRVHENDLSGYLLDVEPEEWTVIKLPALQEDGTALWEMKHTVQELLKLKKSNAYVFESQYQQDPKPIKRGGEFYKLFEVKRNTVVNKLLNRMPYLYNPELPLHLTFDFNVHPYMTCNIHQVVGKRAVQIDEVCLPSPRNRTEDVCRQVGRIYQAHVSGMFIYGDPNGKKQDTRSEKGSNDYVIIMRELAKFRPSLRVLDKAPPVAMRGAWINAVFAENESGLEFTIGDNCVNTVNDYQFGKEDSDGTKLKEKVKDPVSEISYEKYHHCSDANDYFYCWIFAKEFALYQKGGKSSRINQGKSASKNTY